MSDLEFVGHRVRTILESIGIDTVGKLSALSELDIVRVPGLGRHALRAITRGLSARGLALRGRHGDDSERPGLRFLAPTYPAARKHLASAIQSLLDGDRETAIETLLHAIAALIER